MSAASVSLPRRAHDALDVRHSLAVPPALERFDAAGLLGPADVHAAVTLCRLGGDRDDDTLLAAALAVRAPRLGHVCIDLSTAATSVVATDGDGGEAPVDPVWPEPMAWLARLADSPLVRVPGGDGAAAGTAADVAPLVLDGPRLYLDRYWRYERRVVRELAARATEVGEVDVGAVAAGLDRLLPRTPNGEVPDRQRLAAATAVLRHYQASGHDQDRTES